MNHIPDDILKRANEAAIYNLYLYLAHIEPPVENSALRNIITNLMSDYKAQGKHRWNNRDIYRLNILNNAIRAEPFLANSKISNLTVSQSGLTACVFTNQKGDAFVAFRGTGKGEWIDNGEGLSGIPEVNTYKTYDKDGNLTSAKSIINDYSTDQQVEALNWFYSIASKKGWSEDKSITVSGHSKGGNKAQFIAISTDLVDYCFSFDGQGFSPEALKAFEKMYGEKFEARRQKIYSFSTDNDYVNVLGERLISEKQVYFFNSQSGFHYPESMLNSIGKFNPQSEQGRLSKFVESVSEKLMNMKPEIRKYATLGVMNILQNSLSNAPPLNGDKVSVEQTIIGMAIAIGILLDEFKERES